MKTVLFAATLAFAVSGCASSALLVEKPNSSSYRTSTAMVSYDGSNVPVDDDNVSYTQERMEKEFFGGDTPLFTEGEGITVKYRYIGFDEGSQAARYLLGPIAGGSKILLEADFIGPDGKLLSQVRGEGSVSGGFFGGSNKTGIDQAVEKIAEYAAANFKQ
ncbi:MAG: hypothetical protein AAF251_06240 [Pseudomonadota bacterium]